MSIFILNNRNELMMYDWERLHEESEKDLFNPLKSINLNYPIFELFNIDPVDFDYMKKMINSNIIIPITDEEPNEEEPNNGPEDNDYPIPNV